MLSRIREIAGINFQLGVVSFGTTSCGDGNAPSVNTRLEYLPVRSWITSVSGL